jgi:hypothetical protein
MGRERPIVERKPPDQLYPKWMRGIVSPCTGCTNNKPVTLDIDTYEKYKQNPSFVAQPWPCPKQVYYAIAAQAKIIGDTTLDWDNPVFDEKAKAINPVFPGLFDHANHYSYIFVATFEDNVDTGWNPEWDRNKIRCRGPFLVVMPERWTNFLGHLSQGDTVLINLSYYYVDGAEFRGFAWDAAMWQTATGYTRKQDHNVGRTLHAKAGLNVG